MQRTLINSVCATHKLPCEFICSYSTCKRDLICTKCRQEHLRSHPAQFIYELVNLNEIHDFSKIDKLKEMLIKEKLTQEIIIRDIYKDFTSLIDPLNKKIREFAHDSRKMIEQELAKYLTNNKQIIAETQKEIVKSKTQVIMDDPNRMLQQTIKEAEIVNDREIKILEASEAYKQYSDKTKSMCERMIREVTSMINTSIRIIENSFRLQKNKYNTKDLVLTDNVDSSFIKRYPATTALEYQKSSLQAEVLKSKNAISWKDNEILKANKQVKEKQIKIQQLLETLEGKSQQLLEWEQKTENQRKERLKLLQRQKKKKEKILIQNEIIGTTGKTINLCRKVLTKEDILLILEFVNNPICLDLSNNNLSQEDLQMFLKCSTIQTLKFNFTRAKTEYLIKLLDSFHNLLHLELNSAQIDDIVLKNLSQKFPSKLKILYMIDNKITDQGLEQMFLEMNGLTNQNSNYHTFDEMYLSYNKLTQKSIEVIYKYSPNIKKLHISKNNLKGKGAQMIGKLKELQELYVGSSQITKEVFLAITRNCFQIKRLSLVANKVSIQVITQILLGLQELKWLDISHCGFTDSELEKINKLKIFNKDLEIVTS